MTFFFFFDVRFLWYGSFWQEFLLHLDFWTGLFVFSFFKQWWYEWNVLYDIPQEVQTFFVWNLTLCWVYSSLEWRFPFIYSFVFCTIITLPTCIQWKLGPYFQFSVFINLIGVLTQLSTCYKKFSFEIVFIIFQTHPPIYRCQNIRCFQLNNNRNLSDNIDIPQVTVGVPLVFFFFDYYLCVIYLSFISFV